MGDWGARPWETDEAADWFHVFWKKGIVFLIDEIQNFDEKTQYYERFRAAAYLLQAFGSPYIWPVEHSEQLKPLLIAAISTLEKMIDPPDSGWAFLDLWDNDPDVIENVREQIAALKERLGQLA